MNKFELIVRVVVPKLLTRLVRRFALLLDAVSKFFSLLAVGSLSPRNVDPTATLGYCLSILFVA